MMTGTPEGSVSTAISDGIAAITFTHPSQNSLPSGQLAHLASAIEAVERQESVRIILLRSGGDGAFCAGASFTELVELRGEAESQRFFSGFAAVINACRKSTRIVVARIHGKAVGGGVGLAAAADYCLASEGAAVRLSELAIGIGPFVIAPAVIRKIGLPAFSEMALHPADFYSAAWAREKGLYNEVFSDSAALDEAVHALTTRLSGYHPEAMADFKAILWEGTAHWDDLLDQRAAISGRLALSSFTREALQNFLAGRR